MLFSPTGWKQHFFRFYNEKSQQTKTLGTALLSLLATSVAAAACGYLLIDQIESATGLSADYWRWVIAIVAVDALAVVPFAYLRAQEKSMKYAVIKLVNVVITVTMTIVFFTLLPELPEVASAVTRR